MKTCTHISGGYAGALCSKCAPELKAENARLREQLEWAYVAQREIDAATLRARKERDGYKAHMGEAWQEYRRLWLRWFEQRVEYRYAKKREREAKAQAERRGEALAFWLTKAGHSACLTGRICRNLKCAEARAALAATPEESDVRD